MTGLTIYVGFGALLAYLEMSKMKEFWLGELKKHPVMLPLVTVGYTLLWPVAILLYLIETRQGKL